MVQSSTDLIEKTILACIYAKPKLIDETFVKEEYFYSLLIEWARLGIIFEKTQAIDVAGIKSYESLVLSGICGKLEIKPEEILLINDYESVFKKKASVTKLDGNNRLIVCDEEVEYHNSIWDGMSLMDSSKYSEFIEFEGIKEAESLNGKSFVLLRNLWFKSAAFNFNIQKYFSDNKVTLEDGTIVNLGVWISNQRTLYKKESLDLTRIQLLENIGMEWSIKLGWEENYKLAKDYTQKECTYNGVFTEYGYLMEKEELDRNPKKENEEEFE